MRLLAVAVVLAAVLGEVAPVVACPIRYIEDAAVIAAPGGTGANPTVILDPGSAAKPWRIYRVAGARGDGTPEVELPVRVRPIAGTSLVLLDIPFDRGYASIEIGDAIGATATLSVDIDPPADYFVGWRDRVWRTPGVLEPRAPAWHAPLMAGGVAGLLALAVALLMRRRVRVAVP